MNNSYKFFVDTQDNLVCEVQNLHGTNYYFNNDALRKLQMLDAYSFNKSRLSKHNITISNNIVSLSFSSYNDLFQAGLLSYIPNNKEYIIGLIQKYKREQHRKKKIGIIKQGATAVVMATTICVVLGLGGRAISNIVEQEATKEPIEPDGKQESVDTEYDVNAPIIIQGEKENFVVIDRPTNFDDNILLEPSAPFNMPVVEEGNTEEVIQEQTVDENVTYLEFEHNRDSEKGDHAYDNYYELVEKYSNKWGVSPNMIMSMLTQESGGYRTNLMQIQFWSWKDQVINVYNFEAGKYEKLVLTDNPSEFKQKYGDIITITENDLQNPITNISVGTVLLRESARVMEHHIGASIQCYNFGYGNMMKVLKETSAQTGVTVEDILADQENIDFVNYTHIINVGDPNYLANVMQYTNNLEEAFVLKEIDENGNIIENQIKILPVSSMGR